MLDIIQRKIQPIDERLSVKQFLDCAQQQAESIPLEIVEDGVVYELFDFKSKIEGNMNGGTLFYRAKSGGVKYA